jgi:Histidyl-tRNA synthetase
MKKKIEFDKPLWIAAHFGFTPIETPSVKEIDIKTTKDCEENIEKTSGRLICNAPEKAAFIRHYIDKKMGDLPHPLALSWKRGRDYSLELVGYPAGVAEAKLIRASLSILTEEGYRGLVVEINSIGDKDSIASYEKELKNFLAKSCHPISAETKKILKEDVFSLHKLNHEELEILKKNIPSSIASLSSQSRINFKEVLDYLDALGIEYRFAPELVGHKNLCSEALFTIRGEENKLLAGGYRYSRLSKRFGFKRELSLIGATLYGEKKSKEIKTYKEAPKSKFYLIHLGREARMKTLSLIELLRVSRLPVHHYLGRDKLAAQMQAPEALDSQYHIIVGQKEALDGTVTVRNVSTRAQDTIPLSRISDYLKHLPI